ncbi:MAG: hypothetical protein NVS9B8_08390 [Candidatus Limnocylindrales bacterium]
MIAASVWSRAAMANPEAALAAADTFRLGRATERLGRAREPIGPVDAPGEQAANAIARTAPAPAAA